MSARPANSAVFLTAIGNSGSWITAEKFESPTHVAGSTRFVCCSDIVTRRTIGYHEKAPKTRSSGNRKRSFQRPPCLIQLAGVRLGRTRVGPAAARVVRGGSVASALGVIESTVDICAF